MDVELPGKSVGWGGDTMPGARVRRPLPAGLVDFVPNTRFLNTAKGLIALVTPLTVALLTKAPAEEITQLAVPVLALVLTFGTSDDPQPEGAS